MIYVHLIQGVYAREHRDEPNLQTQRPGKKTMQNNILVADQDPRFRKLYQFIFDRYNVYQAASVAQALQFLQQQSIDLVVTEWEFPDGTAQSLIDYMESGTAVPIVLVSLIQDMLPQLPDSVKRRLDKPCRLPDLRGSVSQLLAG